jgi:medium-chain acyl-[acyl-carrier-protein] hydrolase
MLHLLPDDELLDGLRRLNGTAEQLLANEEFMRLLLPTIRADFALVETYSYQPGPPLDVPITAFGGQGDSEVDPSTIAAWSIHTAREFRLHMVPGDHFFIQKQRALVAAELSREIEGLLRELSEGPQL